MIPASVVLAAVFSTWLTNHEAWVTAVCKIYVRPTPTHNRAFLIREIQENTTNSENALPPHRHIPPVRYLAERIYLAMGTATNLNGSDRITRSWVVGATSSEGWICESISMRRLLPLLFGGLSVVAVHLSTLSITYADNTLVDALDASQ